MINTTLPSAFSTGMQGIQSGVAGLDDAARRIARGGVDGPQGTGGSTGGGIIEPMVDLQLYKRSVEASAQVVKTADETLGSLLDIMA
ncbi:flagellar biosynthesis protein FlgE [Marinobacter sp. M3C]|uniref:flagellar basal body rod C-terminal domain-containing protein n=1 Tax=Marinobacter sp. M3C TaxID=2917715 RepID=UPI00200E4C73|nr:flagellar biosynthesis protein FlgE [Marinobacter sp. M3C]UQG59915.1 flagellar biosynthesis protein FlgE [Marinobacter sp. M3C]